MIAKRLQEKQKKEENEQQWFLPRPKLNSNDKLSTEKEPEINYKAQRHFRLYCIPRNISDLFFLVNQCTFNSFNKTRKISPLLSSRSKSPSWSCLHAYVCPLGPLYWVREGEPVRGVSGEEAHAVALVHGKGNVRKVAKHKHELLPKVGRGGALERKQNTLILDFNVTKCWNAC